MTPPRRARREAPGTVRASVVPLASSLVAVVLLGACSGSGKEKADSPPQLPERVCWGAFPGGSVASLLPKSTDEDVEVKGDRVFDLYGRRKFAGCQVEVNGVANFTAWGERSWSEGSDVEKFVWNSNAPLDPTPIAAGDKGIVYRGGVSAYFRCERPGRPPSPRNVSPAEVKIVELGISAKSAPRDERTKETFTVLMQQFVRFAKAELKCEPPKG